MLEEFEKSVKATLYDRLTSPLVGSIVTAWCICNYKFFLIILSDLPFDDKNMCLELYFTRSNDFVKLVNKILSCFGQQSINSLEFYNYSNTFILPLIWASVYIFLYPKLASKVFIVWQKYIKDKRDIKNKIEEQTLLTKQETAKIRELVSKQRIQMNSLLEAKDNEIASLNEEKNNLQKEKDALIKNINQVRQERRKLLNQIELLQNNQNNDPDKIFIKPQKSSFMQYPVEPEILSPKAGLLLKKMVKTKEQDFVLLSLPDNSFVLSAGNISMRLKENGEMLLNQLVKHKFLLMLAKNHYRITRLGLNFASQMSKTT